MIKNKVEKKQIMFEWLFMLLILSFPFGSHIFSFSIGFMTVYPYLVLLSFSFLFALKEKFFPTKRLERFYLLVLGIFVLVSFLFLPFVDSISYAIIDIRSVTLFILTAYVLLWFKSKFGFELWSGKLRYLLKIIFVLMACFAVFEMLTGFHFESSFTEHIIERGLEDDFLYHPAFLYDNPNSFLVYLFLIGFGIILLDKNYSEGWYRAALIVVFLFLISFVIKSRIGVVLSLGLTGLFTSFIFQYKIKHANLAIKSFLLPSFLVFIFLGYTLITKNIFREIPEQNKRVYGRTYLKNTQDDLAILEVDTATWARPVTKQQTDSVVPYRNSNDERKALILNGIDFLNESHYLGVGPGQYRYRHDEGKVNHFAWGNNGPHFWFVEIFSQLGLIPFLFFMATLFWIAWVAFKNITQDYKSAFILFAGLFLYSAVSIIPSAFLILDINWIFLTLLVICASEFPLTKISVSELKE